MLNETWQSSACLTTHFQGAHMRGPKGKQKTKKKSAHMGIYVVKVNIVSL